jgi:hypothetical protein
LNSPPGTECATRQTENPQSRSGGVDSQGSPTPGWSGCVDAKPQCFRNAATYDRPVAARPPLRHQGPLRSGAHALAFSTWPRGDAIRKGRSCQRSGPERGIPTRAGIMAFSGEGEKPLGGHRVTQTLFAQLKPFGPGGPFPLPRSLFRKAFFGGRKMCGGV